MSECAHICLIGFCFCFCFPWKVKIRKNFFSIVAGSTWFCLLFLNILTSKISNLLLLLGAEGVERARGRESYPTSDIPNEYIDDYFLMIYLSISLLFFFTFWYFKGVNQRFTKSVFLQFFKTIWESSR